jgi:tetratricopeptide (TPR) repeat protein
MPYDPRASDRARVSIGQLADLAERAAGGDFSDEELFAVEPLRILADPDPVTARADALALAADPEFSADFAGSRLARMFESEGLLTEIEVRPERAPTLLASADPEPPPEPVLLPEPPPEPTPPVKGARKPKPGKLDPPPADSLPTLVPAPEEDMSAKVDPAASKSLSSEADAARKRGDAAAAETLYNKALDLWNGNAAALIGLSDLAFERGKFERAVSYAEKAVRADAGNRDYQFRLGDAYFKVFRYTDAQQRYQKAADLGHPKAAERLVRVQDKLGG